MTKVQLRRDTAAAWTAANPVLSAGEAGVETDTLKVKVGNGSTAWASLAYIAGSGGGGAVASVNGHVGTVVLAASDVGADASGAATSAQSAAISAAATDATTKANAAQAAAVQRANHTGTQSADTLTDGTTNKAYTATERTKLAAITGTNTGDQDLSALAPKASPALTGTPTAPTATPGTNTTQLATTAFVAAAAGNYVPLLKPLEGVPFVGYGHSWLSGGGKLPPTAALFCARVAARHHTQAYSNQGISGYRMDQVAAKVAATWSANTQGLAVITGTVNDVLQYGNNATATATCKEAFRTALAYLSACAIQASNAASFAYSSGWTAGATTTAGSYVDFAFSGDAAYVLLGATTGTATTVTITNSGTGATGATVNTGGWTNALTLAVKLSGYGAGDHTVRVTLTSGSGLTVIGSAIPSPNPPTIAWVQEGAVNWNVWNGSNTATNNGYLTAVQTALATILTDFPTVITVPPGAGWDYTTMIVTTDGLHPNDRGQSYIADQIQTALAAVDFRQGLNDITQPVANTSYTAPTPNYITAGSTAPGAPTSLAVTPGDTQNVLNWSQGASNGATVTNNKVYRSTSTGTETLLTTISAATTYTDTGLTDGTTYYYKVSAVNSLGEGALSTEASGTPAVPPAATVTDTFTGTDATLLSAHTADTGQSWTMATGNWALTSNQAGPSSNPTDAAAVLDSTKANTTVSVTFATNTAATNPRLIFRYTDTANLWLIQANGTTNYQIFKKVTGTYSSQGTVAVVPANGDVVSVVLSGSTITAKVNGTTASVITDSFNSTATKHGLGCGTGTTARFDNFTVA